MCSRFGASASLRNCSDDREYRSLRHLGPSQADHIHQFLVRTADIEARTTLQEVTIPVPLQLRHIFMGPLCKFDGLDEKYCGLELFAPGNGNPTST